MTRALAVLLLNLFVVSVALPLIAPGVEAQGAVDLSVSLVYPEEGGKYLSRLGVKMRAVVTNRGGDWYNDSLQVTAEIIDANSGIRKFTENRILPLNLSPGRSVEITFSNWSYATPGNYTGKVTIYPRGDTNTTNDVSTVRFDLWTDTWPYPIQLSGAYVTPSRGTTLTPFTFRVEYTYPTPPDTITVIIDGTPHSMIEEDPADHQYTDGKSYYYRTTLPVGPHNYSFYARSGEKNASTPVIEGRPWVNITLARPYASPQEGYVTSRYHFTVRYGSYFNRPPDEIKLHLSGRTFDMRESNPDDENYASGNKQYFADVPGWEVGPGPWNWWVEVRSGTDRVRTPDMTIGGPSGTEGTLMGVVSSDLGGEVSELELRILPLNVTYNFEGARYAVDIYEGKNYTVIFSSPGHSPMVVEGVDLVGGEVKYINVTLTHAPRPAAVMGFIASTSGYVPEDACVILYRGTEPLAEIRPGADCRYAFYNLTPGGLYRLFAEAPFHQNITLPLQLEEGETLWLNITLLEHPPPFSVVEDPVPVEGPIRISFLRVPDLTTLSLSLRNTSSEIQYTFELEGSTLLIYPTAGLIYGEVYTITLFKGCEDTGGNILLWRDFTVEVRAEVERGGGIEIKPPPGSEGLAVDVSFEISFGIHINTSTLKVTLKELSGGVVPVGLMYAWGVDWGRHGATWGVLKVTPKRTLNYSSAYSLVISGGLQDYLGSLLLESDMVSLYTTMSEPDTDGDGVPDSSDAFPYDPTAWKDTDGDGVPDGRDAFPEDPEYSSDIDGDGKPDELDPDADGDGMPDAWERRYGLDPTLDDSGADPDGDGYTNIEEYMEGTDPLSESSNPGEREKRIFESSLLTAAVILVALLVTYLFFSRGGRGLRRERKEPPLPSEGILELDEELEEFLEE